MGVVPYIYIYIYISYVYEHIIHIRQVPIETKFPGEILPSEYVGRIPYIATMSNRPVDHGAKPSHCQK